MSPCFDTMVACAYTTTQDPQTECRKKHICLYSLKVIDMTCNSKNLKIRLPWRALFLLKAKNIARTTTPRNIAPPATADPAITPVSTPPPVLRAVLLLPTQHQVAYV